MKWNKKELKDVFIGRISRFLGETRPVWNREHVEKTVKSGEYELNDIEVQEVFIELVNDKIIYLLKEEAAYFIVHEEFMKKELPDFYLQRRLKDLKELRQLYKF